MIKEEIIKSVSKDAYINLVPESLKVMPDNPARKEA